MNFLPVFLSCLGVMLPLISACSQPRTEGNGAVVALRVMTYNIHHANPPSKAAKGVIDLKAIASVIIKARPDLVALQEVDVNNVRSGIKVNEAKVLAEMTGMNYYFSRAIDYQKGEYGNAVLSRFPVIDSATYNLPVLDSTYDAEPRVLAMVRIALLKDLEVIFASTHLDQHKDENNRLTQAKGIMDIVSQIPIPVIIGGDFNATPDSRTIRELDRVMTRSCSTYCPLTIPADHPESTIDYIMFKAGDSINIQSVATTAISETYASDHLPLQADIHIRSVH